VTSLPSQCTVINGSFTLTDCVCAHLSVLGAFVLLYSASKVPSHTQTNTSASLNRTFSPLGVQTIASSALASRLRSIMLGVTHHVTVLAIDPYRDSQSEFPLPHDRTCELRTEASSSRHSPKPATSSYLHDLEHAQVPFSRRLGYEVSRSMY
jgi:hypothetical protein